MQSQTIKGTEDNSLYKCSACGIMYDFCTLFYGSNVNNIPSQNSEVWWSGYGEIKSGICWKCINKWKQEAEESEISPKEDIEKFHKYEYKLDLNVNPTGFIEPLNTTRDDDPILISCEGQTMEFTRKDLDILIKSPPVKDTSIGISKPVRASIDIIPSTVSNR